MKWIKLSTDLFTDEAILRLSTQPKGDTFVLLWIRLLIAAGKQDNDGFFKAYNNAMLAALLGMPLGTVKRGMDLLEEYGLINRDADGVTIANWVKYQVGMEDRERKARQREKERLCHADVTGQSRDSHGTVTEKYCDGHGNVTVNVTGLSRNCPNPPSFPPSFSPTPPYPTPLLSPQETEREKEKLTLTGELKEKRDTPAFPTTPKRTIFVPPTVDEVAAYCREKRLNVDAGRFVDFYASKGWMVGKNKMKDWHAAVRGWASRDVKPKKGTSYDIDEIEAAIMGG